jgi:hypothetical protein
VSSHVILNGVSLANPCPALRVVHRLRRAAERVRGKQQQGVDIDVVFVFVLVLLVVFRQTIVHLVRVVVG